MITVLYSDTCNVSTVGMKKKYTKVVLVKTKLLFRTKLKRSGTPERRDQGSYHCVLEQNTLAPNTIRLHLSRCIRKSTTCIGENKGADQLRSNCEADQRLCCHYTDSTISPLLKSEISSI